MMCYECIWTSVGVCVCCVMSVSGLVLVCVCLMCYECIWTCVGVCLHFVVEVHICGRKNSF